jgi:hypothetical protein
MICDANELKVLYAGEYVHRLVLPRPVHFSLLIGRGTFVISQPSKLGQKNKIFLVARLAPKFKSCSSWFLNASYSFPCVCLLSRLVQFCACLLICYFDISMFEFFLICSKIQMKWKVEIKKNSKNPKCSIDRSKMCDWSIGHTGFLYIKICFL